MDDCASLNPLRRDGTSRLGRVPAPLAEDYVRVDERDSAALLDYAVRYASILRFWDETDNDAGDWSEFLAHDPSTVAAHIIADSRAQRRARYRELREDTLGADPSAFGARYALLFTSAFDLAAAFERWRAAALPGFALRGLLDRLVASTLGTELRDLLRQALRARALSLNVSLPATGEFDPIWGDLAVVPDMSVLAAGLPGSADERTDAIDRVTRAMNRLLEAMVPVEQATPGYFRETIERHAAHAPHAALLIAFLEMLGHARDSINRLGPEHLDFYYGEVLQLARRPAQPDQVHLVFELAKNAAPHLLKSGTELDAGKDAANKPLAYVLDAERVVNGIGIAADGLKSVFVVKDSSGKVSAIHAAPVANSADGLGAPLEGEEQRWPAFGSDAMPHAEIGFVVASPSLELASGERTVKITLTFDPGSDWPDDKTVAALQAELKANVRVRLTGEKGWINAVVQDVALTPASRPTDACWTLLIAQGEPAVVGYKPKLHGGSYDTALPLAEFVLDNGGLAADATGFVPSRDNVDDYADAVPRYDAGSRVRRNGRIYRAAMAIPVAAMRPENHPEYWDELPRAYPYRYFAAMRLRKLAIEAVVHDTKAFTLENDLGVLNPSKPFPAFGSVPHVGSALLIGCREIFRKTATSVTATVTWSGFPSNLYTHYDDYPSPGKPNSSGDFTASLQALSGGTWSPASPTATALFSITGTSPANEVVAAQRTFSFPTPGRRWPDLAPFDRYRPDLRAGFLRVALRKDFLHDVYPGTLATALADRARNAATQVPEAPYTPTIAGFRLDYTAKDEIDYTSQRRADFDQRVERLFHLGPFGYREFYPIADDPLASGIPIDRCPVPRFEVSEAGVTAEGTLYIGLEGANPPQVLALLFQFSEGSEDPDLQALPVSWSYLTDEGWRDFKVNEVVSDNTRSFAGSGIVELALPDMLAKGVPLLSPQLRWIKASIAANSAAIPHLIAVRAQAARATLRDRDNDPSHYEAPLPAGRIAKLAVREAAIKSVAQPYASFGGRPAESDATFRVRVAERLRHKQRAISIFDYERLVLERFPEVYRVRCINHTHHGCEHAPGNVRVVVLPNLRNRNAIDPLRPRLALSRLTAIREFLEELASDFATIEVTNPEFEELRCRFNVRFGPGCDRGFYTGELERDIIRFLSPWLYDDAHDLSFGGRIHRSTILEFIDARPYVDFVTDFALDHIIDGVVHADVENAEPTRSSAVLVSSKSHVVGGEITSCEDALRAPAAPPPAPVPPTVLPERRYLGNAGTGELHDLTRKVAACKIDDILQYRRAWFSRVEDALSLGYDYCAYCFGKEQSRR